MALFTITSRNIQAGPVNIDIPLNVAPTDRYINFVLTANNWPAGRSFSGGLYESFDAGGNFRLVVGGTWNGPQPTDGSPVAGAEVNIPPGTDIANYRVRITGTVTGGTIRVGGTAESGTEARLA